MTPRRQDKIRCMSHTTPEYQRLRYHAMRNGTWDPQARRSERAATECRHGHEYVEGSFVWKTKGTHRYRQCIECKNANQRARYEERMKSDPTYWVKCIIRNHNNRARKMGDPNLITVEDALWVWNTYGEACLSCGSTERKTLDHVIPVSRGGLNERGNLQPLCKPCNSRKYAKTVDYRPGNERGGL